MEGSFIHLQSRVGGLVQASEEVEEQIRRINESFDLLHGRGRKLKLGENMIERTVRFKLKILVRLFVKVKFFYRIKCINSSQEFLTKKE